MIKQIEKPYTCKCKTASRWIKLYSNMNGSYWFKHYGKRYKLDQFLRLSYPMFYEDNEGKTGIIGGYDGEQWYNPYLLEVHPDGEYIRLWEELKGEE